MCEAAATAAQLIRVTWRRAAGVVATGIWVRQLARCWAAEATAGAEGQGIGLATQDERARVMQRLWAPD